MPETPDPKDLQRLEDRIKAAIAAQEPTRGRNAQITSAEAAWRMVIELVVGLAIGFGIGYGLDSLFGTIPIFLVLFTLLGLAAGIRTMMRTAAEVQAKSARAAKADMAED